VASEKLNVTTSTVDQKKTVVGTKITQLKKPTQIERAKPLLLLPDSSTPETQVPPSISMIGLLPLGLLFNFHISTNVFSVNISTICGLRKSKDCV
jgi:hypothetical protein